MIDQNEIKVKAQELDIHHVNVERDYVFGWLLKSIYENEYLRQRLVFKGGNCLRKSYYPDTRFSADLDFSAPKAIDMQSMADQINQACRTAGLACGVEFLVERNTFVQGVAIDRDRQSYKGRVYFTDFFGKQDDLTISVKVDVTEFDRLYLPAVERKLIHPYSDGSSCSAVLNCMALEEIVANKLKCLIQRRHSHDLFDLVYATFINRSIEVDRGLVLKTFLNKTIFGSSPGAAKEILLGIPMTFFGGVWERFIHCPKSTWFNFEKAAEGFNSFIELLFEGVQIREWRERLFFPSQHRNIILDAGANRKLLRLSYDGIERLVEPYALAYKQAAGKPAREYFYAYDRTGGSSGPGIKSFLSDKVDGVALTDESFEPQYEIELSKAGEDARKGYFGKQFPAQTASGFPARRSFGGLNRRTFKIQCPYCQKIFTRSSSSLVLKEHKSPDGYICRARQGYRIY